MVGWFACIGLTIYWGQAWLYLLDTIEAVLTAFKWSEWHGFRWLEALIEIPIHIFSQPLYCLQIVVICLIFAFTVNKDGYYYSPEAAGPKKSRMSGLGVFAMITFFRR